MTDRSDKPSKVDAEAGEVIVDGPGGVALSLTAAAANETSMRLKRAAAEAERQASERNDD